MKANIEVLEPVIRPAGNQAPAKPVRSPVRPLAFVATATPPLFHAWRA